MTMIMLIYNETLESEMLAFLAAQGVTKFTELVEARGHGDAGGTHLGTAVHPSLNRVRYMAMAEEQAAALMTALGTFRAQWKAEGVQAFSWPMGAILAH